MEILAALMPLIVSILKYGWEWIITAGKVSEEKKLEFEQNYKLLMSSERRTIQKIKDLERRLDDEHKKMDEIKAGKRKFAWEKDERDNKS